MISICSGKGGVWGLASVIADAMVRGAVSLPVIGIFAGGGAYKCELVEVGFPAELAGCFGLFLERAGGLEVGVPVDPVPFFAELFLWRSVVVSHGRILLWVVYGWTATGAGC